METHDISCKSARLHQEPWSEVQGQRSQVRGPGIKVQPWLEEQKPKTARMQKQNEHTKELEAYQQCETTDKQLKTTNKTIPETYTRQHNRTKQ